MKKFLINPFVLAVIILLVWASSGYILYSIKDRGTFGDMFGAINALFSGFAFAGVIYAILLQRKELELQRKELSMTREELKKTAEASQQQVYFMDTQRKREDLYRLILKLSERTNNNYNGNFLDDGNSLHRIMLGENPLLSKDEMISDFYSNAQDTNSKTYRILRYIESDLLKLKELLISYEFVTSEDENCTPFPAFYRAEYGEMVEMLHMYNLIKSDLHSYYCG